MYPIGSSWEASINHFLLEWDAEWDMKAMMLLKEGYCGAIIKSMGLECTQIILISLMVGFFFFRCTGIIIGSREAEPMWHGSKWKSLVVYSLLSWFAYKMNADISFNVSSVSMCFQEYDCKQNQCLSPVVLCWRPSWLALLKGHSFVCNLQVPRILKIWRNKSVTVLIPSKLVLMLKMFNFFFLFCFGYYAINQVLLI